MLNIDTKTKVVEEEKFKMMQYLVLSYDLNDLGKKDPRILYSGSDEIMAKQLLAEYQVAYKGYQIVLVEVLLPQA